MKKLVILIIILNLYANDTKEILFLLKNLQKIQYNYKPINNLFNPLNKKKKKMDKPIIVNIKPQKIKKTYKLEVIFNNKAKIDGKWYKNGDIIDNYKVVIKNNNVFLQNKNKIISLKAKPKVLK